MANPDMQDGSSVEAEVYVWVPELRHLLHGEWDYQGFRNGAHFQSYLEMSQKFLEEYEETGAAPHENGPKSVG
jgi:hypothetical protein